VVHDGQFETEYADVPYLMLIVSVITQHLVKNCYSQQFSPWEECGSVLKFYFVQLFWVIETMQATINHTVCTTLLVSFNPLPYWNNVKHAHTMITAWEWKKKVQ